MPKSSRVALSSSTAGPLVLSAVASAPTGVVDALEFASTLENATPGGGGTLDLWEMLATVAATDLGAARALEPHLDAVGILEQAGRSELVGGQSWGVFAAESSPVHAEQHEGSWLLTGTKSWASLATRLDRALVTAEAREGGRLFAVDLRHPSVSVRTGGWHARGLSEIASDPVDFAGTPATPVGDPEWYLTRPGFWWGGMAVAACWFGGMVGIARDVFAVATTSSDLFLLAELGAIDALVAASRSVLADAARAVDDGTANAVTARRARRTVARASDEVLARSALALGPAPLAHDAAHAKRAADLGLYVRQEHAARDAAALGTSLLGADAPW